MRIQKQFESQWKKISERCAPEAPVIVALSGGVDSMVLFYLLREMIPVERLVVAHFDHRVRPSSSITAQWVKDFSYSKGVSQVFIKERIGKKISEEALRKERYQFLEEVRKETGAQLVALAHHANDQLETLMMRFIRGTTLEGLSAMAPKRGCFVRPLLSFSKGELIAFAERHSIRYHEDETNQDTVFFRNKVRHELIPQLIKLSEAFGGENKFLKRVHALTEEALDHKRDYRQKAKQWIVSQVKETAFWYSFSKSNWMNLTDQEKKAVARRLWKKLGNETLETKELKLLVDGIRKNKKVVLSGNIAVASSCGVVYLMTPSQEKNLKNTLTKGLVLEMCCRKEKEQDFIELLKENEGELRFLQPGDRFKKKKMKRRCLQDQIPAPERALLPVVAKKNSQELIWYFPLPHPFLECVTVPWSHRSESPVLTR